MAEPSVSQSLTHLFNASLQAGQFPSSWKKARVTPLFKGGTTTDCDNYRPISVLPSVSKILESFANSDLKNFAYKSGLIEQHLFAYSKFSSTTVALPKVVDSWNMAIDKGLKSVSVFPDLRKAFDVIRHTTFCSPSFNLMVLKSPNFGGSTATSLRDHSVSSLRTLFRLRYVSLLASRRGRF